MRNILPVALLTVAAASAGAQESFEFRGDDRPTYSETISVEELAAARDDEALIVLDVRLEEDYAADPQLIPGALYKNPDAITEWASELPKDAKIVVYCVRGKWVSQKAATYLSDRGHDVVSLEGGIEAFKADR